MGGSEENVEKRRVNLKRFFKLNEFLGSKIRDIYYLQNTFHIAQKEKNTQTCSDLGGIQRL